MDPQGHNTPLPPFGDIPYFPSLTADLDPYMFLRPQVREPRGPRPRRSYWADQYREMEESSNFRRQRLPITIIKRIMKADDDVQMVSAETPVIFARACEMFILELTHKARVHAEERNRVTIRKEDIVAAVNQTDYCDFLVDIRTAEERVPTDLDPFDPLHPNAPGPADPMSYYFGLSGNN